MREFLFTDEGKKYLYKEYVERQRSTYTIASNRDTYPNVVRRALIHHGFKLRTKKEAQIIALDTGRAEHPTENKERTEEEKLLISKGLKSFWKRMTKAKRNQMIEVAKKRWNNLSEETKKKFSDSSVGGIKNAALNGSKLERFLFDKLKEYNPEKRKSGSDILLENKKLAIIIDGPSHFLPIWGEKQLENRILKDEQRNGKLFCLGYKIVLFKCLSKNIELNLDEAWSHLESILNKDLPQLTEIELL